MKNIKSKFVKLKNKVVKYSKRVVKEHLIQEYFKKNVLFCTYVITCILNSTILRFFCMHTIENYLAIKPIMADLAVITLVGSFGYL